MAPGELSEELRPPGTIRERSLPALPALVHPGWEATFPWLVQGVTVGSDRGRPFDFGFFSDGSPEERVRTNWTRLLVSTGMRAVVHARQVHGPTVRAHEGVPDGLHLTEACDGHVTAEPEVLLAVTTADCVPVFAVDPERRAVALLHAGWRGVAAGVLERGLTLLQEPGDGSAEMVHVHLGPAICERCYEVGPEVFEALGRPVPAEPAPIDLRGELFERAVRAGVPTAQITVSEHCTRCTGSDLFSHRGGDRARQVGYLGIRR